MKKHKQLHSHKPEEGSYGDCQRTVLACLLDLEPQDVPHFADGDGWNNTDLFLERLDKWLVENGLMIVRAAYCGELQPILNLIGNMNPGLPYMLIGASKNGVNHVVICKNSVVYWDPSLDSSGIVGPIVGSDYYEIEFLVRKL